MKAMKPAERELLCQRCDQEYPVWFCPNEVWNRVQRKGEHFLCPTCFTVLAEERGIKPTGWFVRPERDEDGELARLLKTLRAARLALMSYQFGNASPDLAEEIVESIDEVLAHT